MTSRSLASGRLLAEIVHAIVLAVWLGCIVMAAAVAARVFPMMRELEPTLPAYAEYPGGNHHLIVAGHVGEFVFTALAVVQFLGVILASLTLLLIVGRLGLSPRRLVTMLRAGGIGLAAMCVSAQLLWLDPAMNAELRAYWTNAREGNVEQAEIHRDAFRDKHPMATNLLGGSALGLLIAIGAQVASLSATRRRFAADAAPGEPELEEPSLGRGML
ncbi:MAG: hypothetical protein ACF8SC_06920 [Phycisphaerales bacterium JB037]